jgi:hypothetical protein
MADTLKRLSGPASLTNSAATVYTVPGATTAVIRDINVANTTGSAATFTLSIGADAAGKRLFSAVSIPANSTLQRTGSIVLAATEVVQAYSGTNAALTLTLSGVESA